MKLTANKWLKTTILLQNEQIRPVIPETRRMNRDSLQEMLNKYGMVYIKPNFGTFGIGVIRVEKEEAEGRLRFHFQRGKRRWTFGSYTDMYANLLRQTGKKRYLVQKGIRLLSHEQRPFDIRVMVQRNPAKNWETTGMMGRVAHPQKVVTNYHNGGTLKTVDVLLSRYMGPAEREKYMARLAKLGTDAAIQLHKHFPGLKEIGVDIAIGKDLDPWILEVNFRPDPYIFRKLANRKAYLKILRYARAYKRIR